MATTSKQSAAPHCSSSSSSSTNWDVFLSFYGKDTRGKFTSHLYSALVREGISTFMDDPELEKGEEISSGLLNAIRGSKIFVVVLSENYARSRWCLDELVEILTCKRTSGRLVIPVFYYADPSYLRHLKGSYGDAMDVHKERYSADIIGKWRSALAEIAELSGYHLKADANENEADIIQEIVENLTSHLSTNDLHLEEYLVGDYLVGIDSVVEEIYQKLSPESRVVGVCGMGGIGKTTTLKAFYNRYSSNFDISCFVDDVKQLPQGGSSPLPLLHHLLVKLFGRTDYKVTNVERVKERLEQFLCTKKALIVVDDLDRSSYAQLLVWVCNWISASSRIIFTTRDANLVKQLKEDISEVDIYAMRELEEADSLELFSYHAFRKKTPPESFKELSRRFVHYCEGLPLALEVLGSSLLGRTDMSFWKDKLAKVQINGENEIQKIIRMSYEELCETQKEIFLDIVFFFIGRDKDEAIHIFKSCDFFPHMGIPVLLERCLLTITKDNMFQMHNLIQDMGKEVIREELKHGNCRRLYLHQKNGWAALEKLEGIEKIEGLIIDHTMSTKRRFSTKILERMPNLRLIEIIGANDIDGNFKKSFPELRCFRWHHCPWMRFPTSFRPPKLVSLHMPHSELVTLWKDAMASVNLRIINLSYSRNLKSISDLSNLSLVDKLLLRGCRSLRKVHPSIGQLTNMSHLDLVDCDHLKELPQSIGQLTNLGHLDLVGCVKLKRLPETIKLLTTVVSLNLDKCRNLARLPEQLGDMKFLKMLDASKTVIEQLPDSIGHLKELVELKLFGCQKLRKLPEQIGNLKSLKYFNATSSAIEHLPDTFSGLINLEKLILLWCSKLKQLPEQLGKMQCLEVLHAFGTASKELPDSIGLLSRLQELSLGQVRNLPRSIWKLTSLARLYLVHEGMDEISLPDSVNDMKLKVLDLNFKVSICLWLPTILSLSSLEWLTLSFGKQSFSPDEPYSLSTLSNLQHLTLRNWTRSECSFPELPLNLKSLRIYGYATLELLPDLSSLKQLKTLHIWHALSLQSLPPLPPHLEYLHLDGCTRLQDLPDLSMLIDLRSFTMRKCSNLKSISLVQVAQHKLLNFEVHLPDREVAEWFSYKSRGSTLSFTVPPNSRDNFIAVCLWIVYKFKSESGVRAVITNETKDIKRHYDILLPFNLVVGEVQSVVTLASPSLMRRGDRIKVSFKSKFHGRVELMMCGAHLIQKAPSPLCY